MKPAQKAQIKGVMPEMVYAKTQKQYLPLPVAVSGEYITSRWRLSFVERLKILIFGNLFITMRNFGQSPYPIKPSVEEPEWLLSEGR